MISKELLSLILNTDVGDIKKHAQQHIGIRGSYVEIEYLNLEYNMNQWVTINLDTVVKMCKEWCNKQGYSIRTEMHYTNSNIIYILNYKCAIRSWEEHFKTTFTTELEAVIKATEYVAKEKGLL